MGFETIILDADEPDTSIRWNRLKKRCPQASAFCNFEFASRLARAQNLSRFVAFFAEGDKDVAAFLATSRRLGPFSEIVPPRFSPVSPFLVASENGSGPQLSTVVDAIDESFAIRYHRITLHFDRHFRDTLLLSNTAWRSDLLKTYVFDLTSLEDDVTAGWSAGTRRLYRKSAGDYDVQSPADGYEAAVDLCAKSYERSGRPFGIEPSALKKLAADLPPGFDSRSFVATRKATGEVEGALLVLICGMEAFYWIAGSLPGAAMTLIIGAAVKHLKEGGTLTFDLLGANSPGIAEFKRRFGPQPVQYPRLTLDRSRILSLLLGIRTRILRTGA